MPKELTHWHIAGSVLSGDIPASLKEIIRQRPQLYFLGAIAHDTPFYDLSKAKTGIKYLGDQLHGAQGENTLDPLIAILEKALAQKPPETLLGFILGMLTHYVADSTFHPLIFYLSGNYYDNNYQKRSQAVFRHHLLETAIDLWLEAKEPTGYPVNLFRLAREAGAGGRQALDLAAACFFGVNSKSAKRHYKSAWRNHRLFHTAFSFSIPRKILSIYRHFGHPEAQEKEALFYTQALNPAFLDSRFTWKHPVTGENKHTGFRELYEASIQKSTVIFRSLGTRPVRDWPGILRSLEPLSLDSGLAGVPVSGMKFFSEEPIEDKLRL
ncbi:MAG TPA: zinc dependent phospholipase C family protein [Desulfitobacteriaceae bacterium]|jgi:hypothetical protein|nr:zinc dependent phospholipase C family protein [Desulfitobacteriaceae bacterium]